MRLDKVLSHLGYGSRKEVKEIIRKGYVTVNGEVISKDDTKIDEENDEVLVFDDKIEYDKFIYLMLNKPSGYVSATFDNKLPTVLDLIEGYEKRGLFPVGRLDIDTYGLLLITNDGMLAHKMLSPKYHVDKKYYLEFDGDFKEENYKKFEDGIILDDGYKCMSAKFELIDKNKGYITIKEGKFHQVKRMMEALNMTVTFLKRVSFGALKLDDSLKYGEYRKLTEEEIKSLK
ncbi:MAG: rRNA pseudouridine synthase [Acholeplasmatales bacterium]|nr:rRNA pseudouridine synthase [Acholeplasmatales bacterium]